MTLPGQFKTEKPENIFIYHYVEELVASFSKYLDETFNDDEISSSELPFILRIRFKEKTTQKELVELFKVSEGYTAKLLRKFEERGFITRKEDPKNRRQKIVELTDKGYKKTDEIIKIIDEWEKSATKNLNIDEIDDLKNKLFRLLDN